ncbi:o-succinylbenzoate synthase [Vallitalea sp.]|jgi:O-succinylbenzoate synthase|uniref:o-succinylbenzoate synthase n=1 Tax=Vallitalea sp. TaxID=1882829 RepID=UPI0025D0D4F7|nr:o-succinylbenzoate synthase [Vallitalea sp.]MCT4687848.1 o-succinylbenzoate synthase [Vallitalea sp.]
MKIKRVELFKIHLNIKFTFTSAKTSLGKRETIVIKITDYNGSYGYGEVVAFNKPFYTDETIDKSLHILENEYIDRLLNLQIDDPLEIHKIIDNKYPMTIAAIESALIDLYCRTNNIKAIDYLFDREILKDKIKGGIALGDMEYEELTYNIRKYYNEGYKRFKLKIKPKTSLPKIIKIVHGFPNLRFLLDANRSFTLDDIKELKIYDSMNFICIEEPIKFKKIKELAWLQKQLITPICLDESIMNTKELKRAISLQAIKMLNIKCSRLGGMYYTKEAIKICRAESIPFWMGSMVESSIGKMIQVNLAFLGDNFIEGDLSSSSRYFNEDLIYPPLEFKKSYYKLSSNNSFGYEVNIDRLKKYTIYYNKKEV